ncbi:hypothetical protein FM037_24595 [Shewanella psychropiezotolerans]|uniref:DUF306 domain-containing protein n=1 Tax=Shewanella psychropiezotolerans TaxID=2593655 RepID=A0ABX5X3F2_9GAMM|nr:hypothetical protein [Shewanella psychropiezotolerans]QDO85856.1 hypothetical protein FM037_24595 [Shewanella psychropiezotolerans]
MRSLRLLLVLAFLFLPHSVEAKRYWPSQTLTNWTLSLNNGVAYISSSQFADHCNYSRGQINMSGTEFNRALYAYALSAKAKGKSLRYVIDNTQTTCIITGLQEVN